MIDDQVWPAVAAGAGMAVLTFLWLSARAARDERARAALGVGPAEPFRRANAMRQPRLLALIGRVLPVRALLGGPALELPPWVAEDDRPEWRHARNGWSVVLALACVLLALAFGNAALLVPIGAVPFASHRLTIAALDGLVAQRRARIEREVPAALDAFVLALEAGLPFDRAVEAYVGSASSDLADELSTAVRELEVGYRRREVLARLVSRTGSPTFAAIASRVRLAEELGNPLAAALRSLAIDLRAQRRQRLQERALRAPVTMLLPTAGFILPPIFAIVLGPIVVRIASGSLL